MSCSSSMWLFPDLILMFPMPSIVQASKLKVIDSMQVGMLQLPFRLSAPVSARASLESMPSLAGLGPLDGFSTPTNRTLEYAATRTGETRLFP